MHTRRFPELLPGFRNTQRLTVNFLFSLHHVNVMLGPSHTDINNINMSLSIPTDIYIYICHYYYDMTIYCQCVFLQSLCCVFCYVFIAFGHNSAMFGWGIVRMAWRWSSKSSVPWLLACGAPKRRLRVDSEASHIINTWYTIIHPMYPWPLSEKLRFGSPRS